MTTTRFARTREALLAWLAILFLAAPGGAETLHVDPCASSGAATGSASRPFRTAATAAEATANGIREIASAINEKGGVNAVNLRIAEQYLGEFGKLAKTNNSIIIPTNLADIAGVIKSAASVIKDRTETTEQTG